jgi:hypothetical protein
VGGLDFAKSKLSSPVSVNNANKEIKWLLIATRPWSLHASRECRSSALEMKIDSYFLPICELCEFPEIMARPRT